MKILVFNGSPKRDRSDTMHITRAFLEGMNAAGEQDVHIIDVIDSHIEYCAGCFACNHTIITVPESPMFNAPEAAVVTEPRLALVRRAGEQYARTGEIGEALMGEIGSPMIPEEQYAAIVNGDM